MKKLIHSFVTIFFCAAIFSLLLLPGGCTKEPETGEKVSISWLKSLKAEKIDKNVLQKTYTVEGFFVNETVPMLVTDMKLLMINTPMPESSYVILGGKGIDMFNKEEVSYGSFISLKGTLDFGKVPKRDGFEIEVICPEKPTILKKSEYIRPVVFDFCRKYPKICAGPFLIKQNFALLYSGGYNSANAHLRYWNDLKFMYLTLRSKYGFTDNNIVLIYKNGTGEDSDIPVDYAASPTGLNDAIKYLRSQMSLRDNFYVFITNHGGGYHQGEATNRGGRVDGIPGDEIDAFLYDEAIYYYNQTSNDIWDDDLSNLINSLNFASMTAVLEPCFSGGLIKDLKGCNRVLISAASEFEYSWAGAPGNHDMFSYHFTCALNNTDHTGTSLSTNPDTNNDGKVSMLEAFLYAKTKDTASETPYLEDNGDGKGTNTPTPTGIDGALANKTFL